MTEERKEVETFDEDVTHRIELGQALERLETNPDFQKVIFDEYLEQTVLRQHSLLAVPNIKKRGERADIMEDMIASSNLKYFLWQIKQAYHGALNPILTDEEEAELEQAEAEKGAH